MSALAALVEHTLAEHQPTPAGTCSCGWAPADGITIPTHQTLALHHALVETRDGRPPRLDVIRDLALAWVRWMDALLDAAHAQREKTDDRDHATQLWELADHAQGNWIRARRLAEHLTNLQRAPR